MGIVMATTRPKWLAWHPNWSTQPCINPMYKECRFTLKGAIGTKVNDLTKYYILHLACMYWSIKYQNYIFNVIFGDWLLTLRWKMTQIIIKIIYFYMKAYIIMKCTTLFLNHDQKFWIFLIIKNSQN
jgi:hypothetical protein